MIDPTLTIDISRDHLSLPPLHLSASDDGTALGIVGYQEPPLQARIDYAESANLHGAVAVRSRWQQSMLGIDVCPDVASEAELRTLISDLRAALGQFAYTATVTVNDAPAEVWSCDMGSLQFTTGRDFPDLTDHDPVIALTIPVYPIASA